MKTVVRVNFHLFTAIVPYANFEQQHNKYILSLDRIIKYFIGL